MKKTPHLTSGIPPNETRIIREKLGNNTLGGDFHNIMFTENSVNFVKNEADYRNLIGLAEEVMQKYSCGHVFIDVTGLSQETNQYEGLLYLYATAIGVLHQIQYSGELNISEVIRQLKSTQSNAISVLSHGGI